MPKLKDLTGNKYFRLTVLSYVGGRKWDCMCECGNHRIVRGADLRRSQTKSCGCYMRETSSINGKTRPVTNIANLAGKRFGRLLVLRREGSNKHGFAMWLCKCDCGNEKRVSTNHLTTGNTASCGCAYYERASVRPEAARTRSNNYVKVRHNIDLKFALNRRVSSYVFHSLKDRGAKKRQRWQAALGYSINDLKTHLENTMPKGYTWEDFIAGKLHIDHIVPLSAHNFTCETDADFKRAWALSNLRLLPALDNILKADKLEQPFQPALAF